MNLRRWTISLCMSVVGLTGTPLWSEAQASECKAKDKAFGFLVNKLPTAYGLNTCVANNVGTIASALASTFFSSCGMMDVYDLVKNEDFNHLVTLMRDISTKPADISRLVYNYMAGQSDDAVDDLCDAFSGAFGPCGGKVIPKLLPALQKDDKCCAEFSDLIDLLNIVIAPDKDMSYFLVIELINGFNQMICSKKGRNSCGLHIFQQYTKMYTLETFDFFQHMVLPFMTIGAGEECAGLSGKPYQDTGSKKPATTIDFGCCVHHLRPFVQTIQSIAKNVFGDSVWDIVGGMVSYTAPDGAFVDTLAGTMECQFDKCKNPKGMAGDLENLRPVGAKDPGKNILIDTKCTLVEKCSGDKSVCSQVCDRGSVVVPDWLKSSLDYQRNLAFSGPICLAQLPASHNSAINLADGFGNRDQLFNKNLDVDKPWSYLKTNNQVLSMTDQLDIGIRFLEIDTHFFLNDVRTGHCGALGMPAVTEFINALGKTLGNYGKFTWGAELLGCFPSISGIKASEQPLTRDSLDEVKAWLNAHPTEFVVVYLDTGADMKRLDKLGAIDTLFSDTFGDLLVPVEALDKLAQGKWAGGSINEFVDAGHQVLPLANSKTANAYKLYDMCTEKDLKVDHIDDMPNDKQQIGGLTIYSKTSWIRTWAEQIRYISMSATGSVTRELPVVLDAETIPKFLRWNLNLIALDNVDVAKMAAHVWSWAVDEPSVTEAEASVLMDVHGRWVASIDAEKKSRACWNDAKLAWSIVPFAEDCPAGTTFTAPMDPYQNHLLHEALVAKDIKDTSLVINATLMAVGAPTPAPSAMAVVVLPTNSSTISLSSSSGDAAITQDDSSSISSSSSSGYQEEMISSTASSSSADAAITQDDTSSILSSSLEDADISEGGVSSTSSATSGDAVNMEDDTSSTSSASSGDAADMEDDVLLTSSAFSEDEATTEDNSSLPSSTSLSDSDVTQTELIWTTPPPPSSSLQDAVDARTHGHRTIAGVRAREDEAAMEDDTSPTLSAEDEVDTQTDVFTKSAETRNHEDVDRKDVFLQRLKKYMSEH
uniref:PLC-like phosphodiesterase n=1 Tax=Peronospora matthiolae TaxID=2874970 RepID=A0AAV1VBY5_9STRA